VEENFAPLDALPAAPESARADVVDVLPAESPGLGAVPDAERIAALDVLRGFAVLGILVMNIQSFAMIDAAYSNPTAFGDLTGANYWVWLLSHVLADQKFMTIFSMLFGAGIVLMARRQETAGRRAAGTHYRRMGALALFGLLHAYLFWYGDILFSYAICGLAVYLLRNLRPWLQLLLGSLSVAVPSCLSLLIGALLVWVVPFLPEETENAIQQTMVQDWQPSPEDIEAQLAAYGGGWMREFEARWPMVVFMQTLLLGIFTFWRAGGLMLVGMALFKLGVFSASLQSRTYLALTAAGLCLGLPPILFSVHTNFERHWDIGYWKLLGGQGNYWGSIAVSLGWVGLVMLICKQPALVPLMRPFAATGRMALTNYLMHTLICTTIFYGHGFALYGRVERVGQIEIVLAIWVFQLIVSPLWLRFFLFGPAEWLWRALTYCTLPALLRTRGHSLLRIPVP